jgi:3-oxoadipate enol-lactonase
MAYTSGEVALRYTCEGEGANLVLIHELGGCMESWDVLVSVLPQRFRILRYDQRGAGMSEKVRARYGIEDQVRDLESVLECAGMRDDLWLVSVAAGVPIALAYASKHPAAVKGMVLCCPAVGVTPDRNAYLLNRSKRAAQEGMRAVIEESLARSFPPSLIQDPAIYEAYSARFVANDPTSYGLASQALIDLDTDAIVRGVRCRCLVLAGKQDGLRPPEEARKLAERLSESTFRVIDSGHFMHVCAPVDVGMEIVAFIEGLALESALNSFVSVRGFRFHCRVDGADGLPWMVLSNSLATNLSMWDVQVAEFAERYRILRYDQRGHGQTEVPDAACSFEQLAEDAAALLEHFGVKDAILVGVSMGALTALLLGERYPARIRAVIACDGQPVSPADAAEVWRERIAVAEEQGMEALVEPTLQRWFRPETLAANRPGIRAIGEMIRKTPAAGYIASARALQQRYDYCEGFEKIRVPVMLLVGAQDGALPEVIRSLHERMPGSHFELIDKAGHLPNVERPAETNQAIERFLAALPRLEEEL